MNRSLGRLYLVLAGAFVAVIVMLGYWQIVAAPSLNDRGGNPRAAQRELLVDRGRIVSRDGRLLAWSRAGRVRGQRLFQRRYPRPTLASHVIGYVSSTRGRTGVESSWNRYLGGSFGTEPLLQRLNLATKRGANVRLTIDTRVQAAAVRALAGRAGAVVALDPSTGAVLALASAPTFDLSRIATGFGEISATPGAPLLDRATAGRYAPGSTFKVVTAVSAIENGVASPTTRFVDRGRIVVNGRPITNFGGAVYGAHDLSTALTRSINTTFASLGQRLGASRLGATMTGFGFGGRPQIDLPEGEVAASGRFVGGALRPNGEQGGDAARLAIGQEALSVTPLQMALVAAAIANGGSLVRPYVVSEAVDRGGTPVRQIKASRVGTAMRPATSAALTAMMKRVVQEGTGTQAALSGLSVAGKTGTAETGRPNANNAWFIGFAPAEAPRVAVAVVIENTPGTGGGTAAPVAASVMRAAITTTGGTP
ncbi:MAG: penicillin-binding protein 2 [Actinobacteria bacterium]|nr:penicillin-binding protein 2 [Actinomycetota bacterium]